MKMSRSKLEKALKKAVSFEHWSRVAQEHDKLTGNDAWKRMERSRRYDFISIRRRLEQLRSFRASGDNQGLLFTLNEGVHGNMGGMGNPSLYGRAKFGTKQLIVEYIDEIASALEYLASDEVTDVSLEDKLDFFERASICCGRSALMLSGSGTLLYFHIGVAKALIEQDLLPEILSGSSGGAIISGIIGTHTREELEDMFRPEFMAKLLNDQKSRLVSGEKATGRPNQAHIRHSLSQVIPDITFAEAKKISGHTINVSVAPAEQYQTSRLLNAVTSPNVYILDAVLASAAVPGIYPAVQLSAQNASGGRQPYLPGRLWVDGSVSDDLPAKRLMRLYRVNHFMVSQTNPHIVPFVRDEKERGVISTTVRRASQNVARDTMALSTALLNKPLKHTPKIQQLLAMASSVVHQDYTGDINILPPLGIINLRKVLSIRSEDEIRKMIDAGERATWPKIEMIRVQTKLSRTINRLQRELLESTLAKVSQKAA